MASRSWSRSASADPLRATGMVASSRAAALGCPGTTRRVARGRRTSSARITGRCWAVARFRRATERYHPQPPLLPVRTRSPVSLRRPAHGLQGTSPSECIAVRAGRIAAPARAAGCHVRTHRAVRTKRRHSVAELYFDDGKVRRGSPLPSTARRVGVPAFSMKSSIALTLFRAGSEADWSEILGLPGSPSFVSNNSLPG